MDTMTSITTPAPSSWASSGNATVEAMIRSNQIWAAGCRKLGDIMAETVTGHVAQAMTTWQAMGHVKTVKEAVELQSSYLSKTTEHSVAIAKKFVSATTELTHEVISANLDRRPSSTTPPVSTV